MRGGLYLFFFEKHVFVVHPILQRVKQSLRIKLFFDNDMFGSWHDIVPRSAVREQNTPSILNLLHHHPSRTYTST